MLSCCVTPSSEASVEHSIAPESTSIVLVETAQPLTSSNAIATDSTESRLTAVIPSPEPELPESEAALGYFGLPEPEFDSAILELCQEVGNKLGSVSIEDCLKQQLRPSGGLSVLGRPIPIREYPELPTRQSLGRVLLIGGIHGDEYSSVSIVFKWMKILNVHHSGLFHWQFVPTSNPDGLLRRKSQRQNENGVDLNRNFPSADWNDLATDFWLHETGGNARRYPGLSGGSEPEVAWLVEYIREFQPDVIISVHAPYHLVDYDGPPEAPERLGNLHLSRLGVYPGSLGNYAGVDLDKPVVTIELPYAGIMPSRKQISRMWTDLVAWLIQERTRRLLSSK